MGLRVHHNCQVCPFVHGQLDVPRAKWPPAFLAAQLGLEDPLQTTSLLQQTGGQTVFGCRRRLRAAFAHRNEAILPTASVKRCVAALVVVKHLAPRLDSLPRTHSLADEGCLSEGPADVLAVVVRKWNEVASKVVGAMTDPVPARNVNRFLAVVEGKSPLAIGGLVVSEGACARVLLGIHERVRGNAGEILGQDCLPHGLWPNRFIRSRHDHGCGVVVLGTR